MTTTQSGPRPDEAPGQLPEQRIAEPGLSDLSKRDYVAVVRRAF
jgi:hypothetical protein